MLPRNSSTAADSIDNSSPCIDTAEIDVPGSLACCLAPQAERLVAIVAATADLQNVRLFMGTPFPCQIFVVLLSLAALTEVGAVSGKKFVFFGGVFPSEQLIAVREAAKPLHNVVVELGKLGDRFERLAVRR